MKKPLMISITIGAFALSGVLYFYKLHSDESKSEELQNVASSTILNDDAVNGSTPIPRTSPSTQIASPEYRPYEVLNAGGTLVEALRMADLSNDARAIDLIGLGDFVCSQDPDSLRAVSSTRPDLTRAWAIDRIIALCKDFDANQYKVPPAETNLAMALRKEGTKAATQQAMQQIAVAPNQTALAEAGNILVETGKLPLDEIPDTDLSRLGDNEILIAWTHASSLVVCQESGGCGPNSLATVAFCANVGCPEGTDFQSALKLRLSAQEYQAAMALNKWINNRRTRY